MLVTIVTATTGNPLLRQALDSVQAQTYPNIEHLVVVDGDERLLDAIPILESVDLQKLTSLICLPYSTGKNRYNGHRIYGASTFLANGEFITFLDEDNWIEPDHIASLVELVSTQNLDWAYALRKVIDPTGNFVTYDNCQSLGKWSAYEEAAYCLIDVNCYFIRQSAAVMTAPLWYSRRLKPGDTTVDIMLCKHLMQHYPKFDTTGRYTVNYRTSATAFSAPAEFFMKGNRVMQQRYPHGFPWRRSVE